MVMPTNSVLMSDVRRILALAGAITPTSQLSLNNDDVRLMAGNIAGPVKLANCRGSTFMRITNIAKTWAAPNLQVCGWDNQNGPLQAAGATAAGDFSLSNGTSPRMFAWMRLEETGSTTHEMTVELNGVLPPNLSLLMFGYIGSYAVQTDLSVHAGKRIFAIPLTAEQYNTLTDKTSVSICFKDNTYT